MTTKLAQPVRDPQGGEWPSVSAAERGWNMCRKTIVRRCKAEADGWRYINGPVTAKPRRKPAPPKTPPRAVVGPRRAYDSVREASEVEGIGLATVRERCRSRRHGWRYADDAQHDGFAVLDRLGADYYQHNPAW